MGQQELSQWKGNPSGGSAAGQAERKRIMYTTLCRMFTTLVVVACLTVNGAAAGTERADDPAAEQSPLTRAAARLAAGVARHLAASGEDSVQQGRMTGLNNRLRNRIREDVRSQLKKEGIEESTEAGMQISCRLAAETEGSKTLILIEMSLRNRRQQVIHRYREIAVCSPGDLDEVATAP